MNKHIQQRQLPLGRQLQRDNIKNKSTRRRCVKFVLQQKCISFLRLFLIGSVTFAVLFPVFIHHHIPLPSSSKSLKQIPHVNVEPVYDDIVGQVHNWITPATRATKGHQILMVVSHREFLFGCYSFEEYLSPLFHTLFILPEDIARELQVDQLVQKATAATSAGAHLFYSDGYAGNTMALNVGEQFAAFLDASILDNPLDYLVVAMCDVHQLPHNHTLFQSTESMILQMAKDFDTSKAYRYRGEALESNYDEHGNTPLSSEDLQLQMPKSQMGILAMNTILWEQVPDLESVKVFHGIDVGDWSKNRVPKPQSLVDRDLPWMWDVSQFVEGHLVMFDPKKLRKLRQLAPDFISGRKNNAEEHEILPAVANHFNMTIIRNNDLAFHLDVNTENQDPSRIKLDWLKAKTFELIGIALAPRLDFFSSVIGFKETGLTTYSMVFPYKASMCIKFDKGWLPHNGAIAGIPITDEGMLMIVQGILGYFGYIPAVSHEDEHNLTRNLTTTLLYELDGGFPGSRVLRLSPGVAANDDKWTRLLTMRRQKDGHRWTLYMCNCNNPECSLARQLAFSRKERLLEIPLSNEISMETIHIGEGRVASADAKDSTLACYDRYSHFWKTIQKNPKVNISPSERRKLIEELLLLE
ncbi:hypothetical protein ACHAXM_002687 [Skeletonema potamos]